MPTVLRVLALLVVTAGVSGAADFPDIDGWTPAGEVRTYDASNLWEYINGAADAFLMYGFEVLEVREVSAGGVTVTANIYDMGTPLNAFGIYRAEAPKGVDTLDVGVESVVTPPYQCLLLKDAFYVKIDAYEGEITDASGKALVAAIAKVLPGSDEPPEALQVLPREGMVAGSTGFVRESFLGLSDLKNCVHATYTGDGGKEHQVFSVVPVHGETVEQVWKRFGSRWITLEVDGAPVRARKVPYRGLVGVKRTDSGIVGVSDAANKEELLARLKGL